ncbi:MAG: ribonuclease D [Candidatus Symbiobacter sp.]|nr:ribonuclease D [Candidatus Symbiobacter sp.]
MLITNTETLENFVARQPPGYITVDTEFMREKTYWPILCLIQIASADEAVMIDPLADIDLTPLWRLFDDQNITKVFHAARQDLEIFYHLTRRLPSPMVDTQVAAMACGFGEAASYETLATRLAGAKIDKSSRYTDWAQRPLSEAQLQYALADVTHLRLVYEKLFDNLMQTGRHEWLADEMAVLTHPGTYHTDPDEAWQRLRPRGLSAKALAVLRSLAAWREREAQARDLPRGRLLRDEAVMELANARPTSIEALARCRAVGPGIAHGKLGQEIVDAIQIGLNTPPAAAKAAKMPYIPNHAANNTALMDMLKILLKTLCEKHNVATKLVANSGDLEQLSQWVEAQANQAATDGTADALPNLPCLQGWRYDLFGRHAELLIQGKIALTVVNSKIMMVPIESC